MNNRLYVGNLSFNTSSESIQTAFAQAGDVSEVKVITDRETGQSRGFAFVTMASSEAATKAISSMNGAMLDGRALRVNEAEERSQGGGGGGGSRSAGGNGGDRQGGGERTKRW